MQELLRVALGTMHAIQLSTKSDLGQMSQFSKPFEEWLQTNAYVICMATYKQV